MDVRVTLQKSRKKNLHRFQNNFPKPADPFQEISIMQKTQMFFVILVALSLFPGCQNQEEQQRQMYFEQARKCYDQQDYVCAKDTLLKVIEADPEFASAYAHLGETYLR